MKKVLAAVLVSILFATSAYAATGDILEGMGKKAFNGVSNIATSIFEVPVQISKGFHSGLAPVKNEPLSKTLGGVLGFFRGLSCAAGRLSWGVIELAGFWSANPEDNVGVGIPLDAKYVWDEGERYDIFKPSLSEGIKPVGRKLGRGLANTFAGILEVPGQIKLGVQEGNLALGVGRGLWYWFSRELYGIGSVGSCILPNPVDNPGKAFNRPEPWNALGE